MLIWLAAASAFAVECIEPVPQERLEAEIKAAEEAYMKLDDIGFLDHVNIVAGLQLPCIREPLRKPLIARTHRLMGIFQYGNGDDESALAAMEAARHAYELETDDNLLAPEHDLRVRFDGAVDVEREFKKVPEPKIGTIAFDGEHGRERPEGQPVIVQFFGSSGFAEQTLYLGPREPLPNYQAIPRKRNALLVCGASGLGAGAVTLGAGWAARGAMFNNAADPNFDPAKLDRARGTANTMSVLSGLFTGTALGCGIGALVVGEQ